jgi:atrial natriuretic peptide receptor A
LIEIHAHIPVIKSPKFAFCSELLWVAPELIPSTVVPGTPATQKGDVYSFAIILEEIVVRGGPFEAARQFLEPQGEQPGET